MSFVRNIQIVQLIIWKQKDKKVRLSNERLFWIGLTNLKPETLYTG